MIEKFIQDINIPSKDLEKLIGRLVRVSIIIPGSSSFLRDLCHAFYNAKNGISHLNNICLEDLRIWIQII